MNRHETLNHLLGKKILPFTALKLKSEYCQKLPSGESPTFKSASEYVFGLYSHLTESLEIPLLEEVFVSLKTSMLEESVISDQFDEFQQEDPNEVAKFLGSLHIQMQKLEHMKEELIHYISFYNNAMSYLTSFKSSVELFLKLVLPEVKEFKYFLSDPMFEAVFQELTSHINVLKTSQKELNSWVEEIVNKRIHRLIKVESSIRLLQKYRNPSGGRQLGVER